MRARGCVQMGDKVRTCVRLRSIITNEAAMNIFSSSMCAGKQSVGVAHVDIKGYIFSHA